MRPPQQFALDVEKFTRQTKGRLEEFTVEFIQDLNEEIVLRTPVDTGFLRASWWSALNARPGAGAAPGNDKAGALTVAKLNLTAASIRLGDTYFMTNGAAYAMRLEYGFVGKDSLGRSYNQSPRGFVRAVLGRAQSIAAKTAARVGRR